MAADTDTATSGSNSSKGVNDMHRTSRAAGAALIACALVATQAAPAFADPPPWAPAWGWRAKHHDDDDDDRGRHRHHHERHYRPAVVSQPRYVAVPERGTGSCNRELLGTVLGAGAGALGGSQIGKANGNIAAVIAGTVIGGLVGGIVGRSMDQADVQCLGQAMEHAQTGQTIVWRNPDDDADYRVTPTRTYQVSDGRYCREFTESAIIDGRRQQVYGTACRQPDGSWQIQK